MTSRYCAFYSCAVIPLNHVCDPLPKPRAEGAFDLFWFRSVIELSEVNSLVRSHIFSDLTICGVFVLRESQSLHCHASISSQSDEFLPYIFSVLKLFFAGVVIGEFRLGEPFGKSPTRRKVCPPSGNELCERISKKNVD